MISSVNQITTFSIPQKHGINHRTRLPDVTILYLNGQLIKSLVFKTLKHTLRPNNEQNFDFRIFFPFSPGHKGTTDTLFRYTLYLRSLVLIFILNCYISFHRPWTNIHLILHAILFHSKNLKMIIHVISWTSVITIFLSF